MAVAAAFAATAGPASATTFTNPATITINHGTCDAQAPATPYGSPITVAGLAGTVTDVNVTLTNVTDPSPIGRRALLVGPQGQTTLLLHEVFANGATGVTFTLDDEAAGEMPGTLASGTYKPTTSEIGCGIVNEMTAFPAPAPAPAAVSNEFPHYGAALSTFDGTNPNGVWSLYVIDDSDSSSLFVTGSIGGWSLDITTSVPQTYASAVLADTPAGFWRFGEPSGTALHDASPHANNGTYLNGVALGVPGAIAFDPDTAATFDGVDDLGRIPDANSLDVGNTFTIEGWVKRTSAAKSLTMMSKGFQVLVMSAADGSQVWLRKPNVTTITKSVSGVPLDSVYHHIVVTKNGSGPGTVTIYIDGHAVGTTDVAPGQIIQDDANALAFGSTASTKAQFDEFALYDGVLTAAQVHAHWVIGVPN
jgi:hypothetical protein